MPTTTRLRFSMPWALLAGSCVGLVGCASTPTVSQDQMAKVQQQQVNLIAQQRTLTDRASALTAENQTLQRKIAEYDRRALTAEEHVAALNKQMENMTLQLADAQKARDESQEQYKMLTASLRRQSSVPIAPNNSLLDTLPKLPLPPGSVRHDGDVIRVSIPSEMLFATEQATLTADGAALIKQAGEEVWRIYPNQMIGVEGHIDDQPLRSGRWRDGHHLSLAQAMAVFNALANQTTLGVDQLLVTSHGANSPIHSNGTAKGQSLNRRIELVVYPKTKNQAPK